MTSKLRINAKKLYFVYKDINKNISYGVVLKQLERKLPKANSIKKYFLVYEPIAGSKGRADLHVVLVLETRCDITNKNHFDLCFEKEKFIGIYKTGKGIPALLTYLLSLNGQNFACMGFRPLVSKEKKELTIQSQLEEPPIVEEVLDQSKELFDTDDEEGMIKLYNEKYKDKKIGADEKALALR